METVGLDDARARPGLEVFDREGERVGFVLSFLPSGEGMHEPVAPFAAVEQTVEWWPERAGRAT